MEDQQGTFDIMTNQHIESATSTTNTPTNSEIIQRLDTLLAEMHSLRQDFDTKVKYDESKERLTDTLHLELQAYREGLHFKILRPLFLDLIAMYDDLGRIVGQEPVPCKGRGLRNGERNVSFCLPGFRM